MTEDGILWWGRSCQVLTGLIPVVGEGLDAKEAITGEDWLTGEQLSPGERIMSGGAALLPVVSGPMVRTAAKELHHLLPRQFESFFKKVNLDIEDYKISLDKADHRLKPDGLHTGSDSWNKQWKTFFEETVDATKEQILKKLDDMKKTFKID